MIIYLLQMQLYIPFLILYTKRPFNSKREALIVYRLKREVVMRVNMITSSIINSFDIDNIKWSLWGKGFPSTTW